VVVCIRVETSQHYIGMSDNQMRRTAERSVGPRIEFNRWCAFESEFLKPGVVEDFP